MSKLRDAAQQALEALLEVDNCTYINDYGDDALDTAYEREKTEAAITALRTALAEQPEQETGNWIVYNSGAEVASGLSLAEALEYLTPERLARQWCAVCVVDQSNLPKTPQPAKPAEQEPVAWCDQYEGHIDGLRHYSYGGSREMPLYLAPRPRRRLTDEEIDNTTRKQVDDLLDHIYEYGTAAEGIDYRVRAIARAIEAAVWGDGK